MLADLLAWATAAPLALLGVHRAALLVAWVRAHGADTTAPPLAEPPPRVTVQLPVRNEPHVVERLIDACAALDWPAERLELQLLDDSDDDTSERAARALARARGRGIVVTHLRRAERDGFKAGALSEGLACARGDVCVVLDADFTPASDLLRRLVPWLAPGDGTPPAEMVQARWGHHREDGPLRAAQALALDAHFLLERVARARGSGWFAFNGTAGAWRREAVARAGGWQGDTLTEDMDLSYRALVSGAEAGRPARFVYLRDVVVQGELPDTMGALLAQQRRWTKGTVEVLRKLGVRILRTPAPGGARLGVLAHLIGPFGWPAGLLAQGTAPLLALLALRGEVPSGPAWLWALTLSLTLGAQAAWLAIAGGARAVADARQPRNATLVSRGMPGAALAGAMRGIVHLPVVAALGAGLAWELTGAVIEGLRGVRTPFVRTPKRGDDRSPALRQGHEGPPQAVPAAHAAGASEARPQRPDGGAAAGAPRLPETVLAAWGTIGAVALLAGGHPVWAALALPQVIGNMWVAHARGPSTRDRVRGSHRD